MPSHFLIQPCTSDSKVLVERAEHVLLGLSPWNGYYKPRNIEALVLWAHERFRQVDVFVPGYEAAHTLTASGVQPPEAVHRTRRAVKQLRGAARRALERAGATDPEGHLHTWTQLANRSEYVTARARAQAAYRDDPAVRRSCRLTARGAVRHASGVEPSETQIDQAVSYPIAELPLVVEGPAIFRTPSLVFVYHRRMDLLEPLFTGNARCLRPAPGQGYAVVTPSQPTPRVW